MSSSEEEEETNLATRRSRRQRSSKVEKRAGAIERLKDLTRNRGKNKYELVEEKPVYEEVSEEKYAKMVVERQKDEWIVDDDYGDYYEDGREIFDDEHDDGEDDYEDQRPGMKRKVKMPIKKASSNEPDDDENEEEVAQRTKQNNLRAMFMKISQKAKKAPKLSEVEVENDDVLNGILSNLDPIKDQSISGNVSSPSPARACQAFTLQKRTLPRMVHEQGTSMRSPRTLTAAQRMRNLQQYRKTTLGINVEVQSVNGQSIKDSMLSNFDKILQEAEAESDFAALNDGFDINGDLGCLDVKIENVENEVKQPCNGKESEEWMSGNFNDNGAILGVTIPKEYEAELDFKTEGNDKCLQMYWFDLHELQYASPGTVYMFGKIKLKSLDKFVSCCLIVRNIERRIYLLPRNVRKSDESVKVTTTDVYDEFNKLATTKFKLSSFKSRKIVKMYAFDQPDVPEKTEYLEVLLPASTNIPMDLQGDTFSRVFGTNQSSLERLLLDSKLMGPSWIKIKNPRINSPPVSWCKIELVIDSIKNLAIDSANVTPAPSFSLISLTMKTYLNPKTKLNELVAISALVNRDFNIETGLTNIDEKLDKKNADKNNLNRKFDTHFIIITKPSSASGIIFPIDLVPSKVSSIYKKTKVNIVNSERELLNCFMAKFHQLDPDVLIGHDMVNFDLEVLLSRFVHHKIGLTWSKLGRLRRTQPPSLKKKDKLTSTCGRLVVDIKISARELIRSTSYDLTELSSNILKRKRLDIENHGLETFYASSKNFFKFIDLTMIDNDLILSIFFELNILPLSLQITKIAGNSFSRTLLGGRSERNEYLLLHAFHDKNYIYPDKYHGSGHDFKTGINPKSNHRQDEIEGIENEIDESKAVVSKKNKKGASYAGGLVLDPKVGYYTNYVLILDFNSLYPTIMREFNICFTTINLRDEKLQADVDEDEAIPSIPSSDHNPGILPTEITKLVETRREVKKLLQAPNLTNDLKVQYDIKQKALKLTANSMYGCLGFSHSRFYAKPLAALITYKGREILMATKMLVEGLGFEVIYGDTDSIMIHTKSSNYEEALKISIQVQAAVNLQYKHLEIDCDGVLKSMLLLKKKKYAALVVSKNKFGQLSHSKELKGLDIVRRDWSIIAKKCGEKVVDEILTIEAKSCDLIVDNIHTYLKTLSTMIKNGQVPVESFIITKQLTKNPEDYPDKKSLSHVSVALEWNSWNKSGKKLRAGDVVPYIVVLRTEQSKAVNEQPASNESQPKDPKQSQQVVKEEDEIKRFNMLPSTQRAIHPDIYSAETSKFKIDTNYYLSQQIHPVISRLVEPIDGTDPSTIAEMLGIESTHCCVKSDNVEEVVLAVGEERYDVCRSLFINCPDKKCGKKIEVRKPLEIVQENGSGDKQKQSYKLPLSRCPHCATDYKTSNFMGAIHRQLQADLRSRIDSFYAGWMTCEDPVCKYTSRLITGPMARRGPECPECKNACMKLDVTSSQLHLQFSFYEFILDLNAVEAEIALKSSLKTAPEFVNSVEFQFELKQLKHLLGPFVESIRELKSQMGFNVVKLDYIFKNQLFAPFRRKA